MTLQDDVARHFVQSGMRKVVGELTGGEDPIDYRLEEPVGEGWIDILVKTNRHKLMFEIKTNIKSLPTGEVHEPDVGGTIRQLKKYRKTHPKNIIAVIIPFLDFGKWAPYYANEGFWVVIWEGKRVVRCPSGHQITVEELVAPNHCGADYCGYRGLFEQVELLDPIFYVCGACQPKNRED